MLCFCSAAGASQLASRKAPGPRGVRGSLPLLWCRHRPRTGRQAGALWHRLSGNQQGEREHNKSLSACVLGQKTKWFYDSRIKMLYMFFFFHSSFFCRRWMLWSVRFSCWRICTTSGLFSTMVVFGTLNRGNSPFLLSLCLGCVLHKPHAVQTVLKVWLRYNKSENVIFWVVLAAEMRYPDVLRQTSNQTHTGHIC